MLGIKLTKKYRVGLENFWNVRWLSIKKLTRQQQKGNKAILTGKSFTSFDTFFNNTTTAAVSKQHCEIIYCRHACDSDSWGQRFRRILRHCSCRHRLWKWYHLLQWSGFPKFLAKLLVSVIKKVYCQDTSALYVRTVTISFIESLREVY